MKKVITTVLVSAVLTAASLGADAASKNAKTDGKIHLATDTRVMPVAVNQANRIYVEGGRISKVFGNMTKVQCEKDDATGSLYVFPVVTEQVTLYVVSEAGETHSVTLSPKENIPSQTISIKEQFIPDSFKNSVGGSFHNVADPQSVIQAVGTLDLSQGKKFKDAKRTDGKLVAEAHSEFPVGAMKLQRWSLKNPTKESIAIYEGNFYRPGDLAIATLISELPSKGRTDLWIVKGGQ